MYGQIRIGFHIETHSFLLSRKIYINMALKRLEITLQNDGEDYEDTK
ncbi:hypothetical protein THO17_23710 [Marinomonas sp. THO17]